MKKSEINNPKTIIVKKERRFKLTVSLKSLLYILLFIIIIILIWIILHYKWLEIELNEELDARKSIMFGLLSSMTLLMFMLACGVEFSYSRAWIKFIFLIIIILIVYYGFVNVGITLIFNKNFGLLEQKIYCSNNEYGLLFFIQNWLFWTFVYLVSLMFMSRD